jgi:dipeptidyl aminopeptidase/acylaminoacyl peptidase
MPAVCQFDAESGKSKRLYEPALHSIPAAHISNPEAICFPGTGKTDCYGYFYPPVNADFAVPTGEKPPLIVSVHGGPTYREHSGFRYSTQFWTSRGFAVVDVNYRGSTGYGRNYRDDLRRNWGVVDVEDCIAAARYLVERGDVDAKRLVIRGPSAGGYTTLRALIDHSVFAAGVDLFGPADLESSILEGHRFESGYFEYLVGAYPEERDRLIKRSPLYQADKIERPLLVLQGGMDRVVPPAHSKQIVDNLKKRNIPATLVLFEDEAHGFRKSQNIRRAYAEELEFYTQIFRLGKMSECR